MGMHLLDSFGPSGSVDGASDPCRFGMFRLFLFAKTAETQRSQAVNSVAGKQASTPVANRKQREENCGNHAMWIEAGFDNVTAADFTPLRPSHHGFHTFNILT